MNLTNFRLTLYIMMMECAFQIIAFRYAGNMMHLKNVIVPSQLSQLSNHLNAIIADTVDNGDSDASSTFDELQEDDDDLNKLNVKQHGEQTEQVPNNPNSDDEYIEYGKIEESSIDKSIEKAVQAIIEEGLGNNREAELSPVEKFQRMYLDIKSRKDNKNQVEVKMDHAVMLEQLLGGEQTKDPFDERKVMMKLRNMLNQEDFKDLFLDPTIGDWL